MSDSEDYPPDFDIPLNQQLNIDGFIFVAERVVGRGSFGIVYLIKSPEFQQPLALKIVLQDRRYKNRELQILQRLRHPNTTILRKGFFQPSSTNADDQILYIVMDYYPETIHSLYKQYARLKQHVPLVIVRLTLYQLARSLAYLHAQHITHRDIKPTNVLFDPGSLTCVLCDFGSAKQLQPNEPNVAYICSRYYRAPELVLGSTIYDQKIDIWSFGCIMAEILLGQPLFPGESSVDQFVEIVKVLGAPSQDEFTAMNASLQNVRFKDVKPYGLQKVFRSKAHADAVDLMEKCLQFDPKKRPEAIQIIGHPFFDQLRKLPENLPGGEPVPELFDFTEEEIQAAGEGIVKLMKTREIEKVQMDEDY
ncbi:Kinase [Hexamita inflata]|uniref:CMGC GSK n=1 Tax=Hexamita inflata TaxID=28002 RepID=A0AA86UT79_9EUKA|nr:CMGC GSK [Hexamita inflata]CAI9961230.1 CMGC GSK [Hexamita inflata]CAI9963912.1 CMGC GSK [Hexamita inflata]